MGADSERPSSSSALPRSPRLAKLLLSVFSLVVCLIVLEITFRAVGADGRQPPLRQVEILQDGQWKLWGTWGASGVKRRSPYPGVSQGEYVPDSVFRFVYFEPGASDGGWTRREVVNRINSYGLRGRAVAVPKPPGTFRIVVLGDSFTFGEGVAEDETFSARLEGLLRDHGSARDDPRRIEVVNAGVAGYNTRDEVVYLKNRWVSLEPDLVLLVFYLNDAYDDNRFASLIMGTDKPMERRLQQPAEPRSYLFDWARAIWKNWRLQRRIASIYRSQFSSRAEIDGHDWAASKEALAEAARFSRARGIPFGMVIFPELHSLDDGYPFHAIHEEVRRAGESLGFPVKDLFPTFEGEEAEELWAHSTDHHPGKKAHALAASSIFEFLLDERFGVWTEPD
jgi:hypothetical protein